MPLQIRKATPADIPSLQHLQSKLVDYERALDSTIKKTGKVEYYDIEELVHSKEKTVLIAEVDGKPVGSGFGEIHENPSCYTETHHGYIGLMFVEEGYRGQNIGGSIMKELLAWFKAKSIRDIRLKLYTNNAAALKAYEKYGFKPFVLEMQYKPDA